MKISKKGIIVISICVIMMALYYWGFQTCTTDRIRTQDERVAHAIEKALNHYIRESNDVKLNNLNVISKKTKCQDIIIALEQEIQDKEYPSKGYGPMLVTRDGSINCEAFMPPNDIYKGYKIEIFVQEKKAKVSLCKKEADAVVFIYEN